MRIEGTVVDIDENGILHIRIPFVRILERKDIKIEAIPIHHTKREKEVLRGILDLKRNKEIGYDLDISERTVKFHVGELLRKHKVCSRIELAEKLRNEEGESQ